MPLATGAGGLRPVGAMWTGSCCRKNRRGGTTFQLLLTQLTNAAPASLRHPLRPACASMDSGELQRRGTVTSEEWPAKRLKLDFPGSVPAQQEQLEQPTGGGGAPSSAQFQQLEEARAHEQAQPFLRDQTAEEEQQALLQLHARAAAEVRARHCTSRAACADQAWSRGRLPHRPGPNVDPARTRVHRRHVRSDSLPWLRCRRCPTSSPTSHWCAADWRSRSGSRGLLRPLPPAACPAARQHALADRLRLFARPFALPSPDPRSPACSGRTPWPHL